MAELENFRKSYQFSNSLMCILFPIIFFTPLANITFLTGPFVCFFFLTFLSVLIKSYIIKRDFTIKSNILYSMTTSIIFSILTRAYFSLGTGEFVYVMIFGFLFAFFYLIPLTSEFEKPLFFYGTYIMISIYVFFAPIGLLLFFPICAATLKNFRVRGVVIIGLILLLANISPTMQEMKGVVKYEESQKETHKMGYNN